MPPVLGLGLGVGFGGRRASVAFVTASGQVMHSGFAQAIGGLANGATSVKLYWGSPNGVLAGTASVVAGAWSTTVTPAAAQVGETALVAVASGAIAALSIVVRATPLDLSAAGWWVANDGNLADSGFAVPFGAVTLDEASVNALSAWTQINLQNWASGGDDPYGGSDGYVIQETTDGAPVSHRTTSSTSNVVDTWIDIVLWLKTAPSGRDWFLVYQGGVGTGRFVNPTTGADVAYGGDTTTTVEDLGEANGGRWFKVKFRNDPLSFGDIRVYPADTGPTLSYQGDGRVCGYIYGPTVYQPRVSAVADESGNAADLVQATDANQPLYYAGFKTVNGIAVPYREAGRASYLSTSDAGVVGAFSGDDPSYAVVGVLAMANVTNSYWLYITGGAGSAYDAPLRIIGSEVQTARRDSSTTSLQVFSGVSASAFASSVVCTVIRKADRTTELYIGRLLVSTAPALADLGASTHTTTNLGITGAVTTPDQQFPELTVIPGEHTHAELADIEEAMAARWLP